MNNKDRKGAFVATTFYTKEQQIEILESIRWKEMKALKEGLCWGITSAIRNYKLIFEENFKYGDNIANPERFIPLFTYDNAKKFFFVKKSYRWFWWPRNFIGYFIRKRFVKWMIKQLKDGQVN